MLDGKKGVAQKVVYGAFDQIKEKTEKGPHRRVQPGHGEYHASLEVKARRVGGATYQVPMEVRPARRTTLGLRWLTAYARSRSESTMAERLAGELMDAANNLGSAVKKREDSPQGSRGQQGVRPYPLVSKEKQYAEKNTSRKYQ